MRDIGAGRGKNYSLNFPLNDGIDDASFTDIFETVIGKVMESYRPEAVVLQCGADSLTGDRLGCFNLTLKGHGRCVSFVKKYNLPTLVLGGGGYTIRNVARCWAYETALCVGVDIPDELPYNEYYEYYGPDYRLHIAPSNMENLNSKEYLEQKKIMLLEQLREIACAPGVGMVPVPDDAKDLSDEDEDERDPDRRLNIFDLYRKPRHAANPSDSEDEDAYSPAGRGRRVGPANTKKRDHHFAPSYPSQNNSLQQRIRSKSQGAPVSRKPPTGSAAIAAQKLNDDQ